MKEFKFKRTKIKIESEAGEFELRFPTVEEANEFDRGLADKKTKYEDLVKDYLCSLGLSEEGYYSLEFWQVKEILVYFRDPLGKDKSARS